MDYTQLLQNFGFPIVCVIACGIFIYKIIMRDKDEAYEREKALVQINSEISDSLVKVADTINETNNLNKELSEKNRELIDLIDSRLEKISTDMEIVKESLKKE